jgi:hypothetical protein
MKTGNALLVAGAGLGLLAWSALRRRRASGVSLMPALGRKGLMALPELVKQMDRTIMIPTAMCAASIAVWTRGGRVSRARG